MYELTCVTDDADTGQKRTGYLVLAFAGWQFARGEAASILAFPGQVLHTPAEVTR